MMESESGIGNGSGWKISPSAAMDALRLTLGGFFVEEK